jgi:tripartite-type tricarboxylate transporter receptor subunit TctC
VQHMESMIVALLAGRAKLLRGALCRVIPAIAAILVIPFGQVAWSQTTRTIKVVVPLAPGGGADIMARMLAEQISRAHGLT